MKKAFFLLVMVTALVTACEQSVVKPDPEAMGYEYYPLEVGSYRIYNVTDIRFKSNVGDTTRFQMRERIDTTFTDQSNNLTYKIVRSVRADESKRWIEDSVITVVKTEASVLLTKNNTKYVKMVFPVQENKTWAGDAFNDRRIDESKKEAYVYNNVGESYTVGGQTFDKTVTVIQGNPLNNLVYLDDRKEVYAEDIGLVFRIHNKVTFCNETDSKECEYGIGYKLFGHERHEELVSYGKE